MGLWRHHHDDGDDHGSGVLGALGFLLGLHLLDELWRQHANEVNRRGSDRAAVGWGTFVVLILIVAVLVQVT